jgi:hypothetical protein
LALCVVVFGVLRASFFEFQVLTDHALHHVPLGLIAVSLPIAVGLSLIFLRRLTRIATVSLLIISPLTLFMFTSVVWRVITPRRLAESIPVNDVRPAVLPQRVVWIIFDEMDQHVAFSDRPAELRLPELDAFRRNALYATMATAPGTQTHYSIPALITGRSVKTVTIRDGSDLLVTFDKQTESDRFSASDNIFRQAHRMGFRTGLVGNYLPYCRILQSDLDFCATQLIGVEAGSAASLDDMFAEQMATLLHALPFHDRLPVMSIDTRKHTAVYQGVLADAKTASANPRLNLLMIHFPIPHLPGILGPSYVDNLILVDQTLRQVRESMVRAGLWESSNILISADHGFRLRPGFDNRVPFLLKLSGQTTCVEYNGPFNTLLTRDLILFLLSQPSPTPQIVSSWLSIR